MWRLCWRSRLVAQVVEKDKPNTIRIVYLDKKGKRAGKSDPVVFPAWVVVGVEYGRSFTSSAWRDVSSVYLVWQARAWYAGGARPSAETERRAQKNASGVAKASLATGKVEMLETSKAPQPPTPKYPAEVVKAAGKGQADQVRSNGLARRCCRACRANRFRAASHPQTLGHSHGESSGAGRSGEGQERFDKRLSADARTVLVLVSGKDKDVWTAFSTETGKEMSKFDPRPRTISITGLGERAFLIVEGPPSLTGTGVLARTLISVDLKTGKDLWEHSLEGRRLLPARK